MSTRRGDQANRDSSAHPPSCTVFIGNIPYDAVEEQLVEAFGRVGPIESFRLVFDKDTGKPKGYGFCEYRDEETALNAIRLMNGYDVLGRGLRVDFAETASKSSGSSDKSRRRKNRATSDVPPNEGSNGSIKRLPSEMGIGNIGNRPEMLPQGSELVDMMIELKRLVESNRDIAQQLLLAYPQFAYALLQGLVVLGMVSPVLIQQLLQGAITAPLPQQPIQPQLQPNFSLEQQQAMLQQVLQLTPDQIEGLPPLQQQQIRQLQQTFRAAYAM